MPLTRTNLSEGRRILLLVDDDSALRQSLAEQLRQVEGYDCREAETGRCALDLSGKERFDGVLLDVGLPDVDGREVCRSMRRAGISSPIIMLTAADSDADMILGLESGADDYSSSRAYSRTSMAISPRVPTSAIRRHRR